VEAGVSRPADLPSIDHFEAMPCGTRAKYVSAKCRCAACRAANCRYVRQRDALAKTAARELAEDTTRARRQWVAWRLSLDAVGAKKTPAPPPLPTVCPQIWTAPDGTTQTSLYQRACVGVDGAPCPSHSHLRKDSIGDVCGRCRARLVWNGLVPADAVRAHLKKLSRLGVGYKSVAAAADVSKTVLADVLFHGKSRLRAQVAQRVLAIDRDATADHALVSAGRTWQRLQRLLAEGFTKTELARRLGSKARVPALQFQNGQVLAKTAARVERFYRMVMVE
jgi:hypothetical protein